MGKYSPRVEKSGLQIHIDDIHKTKPDTPETPNAAAPVISTRLQRSGERHVMQWLTPDRSLHFTGKKDRQIGAIRWT
jgi:hypothetical protein